MIDRAKGNLILALSLSIYILIALNSWIFSSRRLNRPGVSGEVRAMFSKKHTTYVLVFIVIWIVQLSASYYHLFNPILPSYANSLKENSPEWFELWKKNKWDYISGIMMFSTGIILASLRLNEPFFRYLSKCFWLNCFGILLCCPI